MSIKYSAPLVLEKANITFSFINTKSNVYKRIRSNIKINLYVLLNQKLKITVESLAYQPIPQ